jgi:DNA-binding response OmpR family regulator
MRVPIFHGRSVAVVDDDVAVRKAIGTLLQSRGFAVEGFACAEDLLVFPRLDHVVCMIVEVHLPGWAAEIYGAGWSRRIIACRRSSSAPTTMRWSSATRKTRRRSHFFGSRSRSNR